MNPKADVAPEEEEAAAALRNTVLKTEVEKQELDLLSGTSQVLYAHIRQTVQAHDFQYLTQIEKRLGFDNQQMAQMYAIFATASSQMADTAFGLQLENSGVEVGRLNIQVVEFNKTILWLLDGNSAMRWQMRLDFQYKQFRLYFITDIADKFDHQLAFSNWQTPLYFFSNLCTMLANRQLNNLLDQRLMWAFDQWINRKTSTSCCGQILPARLYDAPPPPPPLEPPNPE